ncbi:MAG: hypothetical protein RSC31_08745 [Anaerovoracaceae bacterium]
MKKKTTIMIITMEVIVLLSFCIFLTIRHNIQESQRPHERGMFEWREETIEHPESVQPLIEKLAITKWYQEFPPIWNPEVVSEFSSTLHQRGVKVYALFGSVDWGYESDGATLTASLKQVTNYNKTAQKDAQIDGVMIDVEPYTSSRWKKHKEKNMKNYVDGMLKAYQSVAKQKLKVAICIPRHYDDQGLSEELERLIAKGCDEVAVMNYECGHEVEKIKTEAMFAKKYGKELHCILEFQEVGKHGLVEEKTYCNKGLAAAQKAWKTVDDAYPKLKITWDYHCTNPLIKILENE